MNNPGTGLSPTETRKLAEFLQSGNVPANTLTFHQLQGFLFNVCCTPVMLPPSVWLPVVFGNQELEFESEDDSWVFKALMGLYNEINFGVLEGCPRLPEDCQLASEVNDNFKPGSALHEWCSGFNLGSVLAADSWDESLISDDAMDEVDHIQMFLSFFADEDSARELKQEDGEVGGFEDILPIMFGVLPDFMVEYAALGRGLYLEGMDDELFDIDPELLEEDDAEMIDTLINAAMDNDNPVKKARFARAALALDENCVDALLILADTCRPKDPQQIIFLEQAVAAGERALGEEFFEENAGHFWGLWETRPYMRALASLALACRENGKPDRSMALYEKALELNPGDNQGIRYILMTVYLEQSQLEKCDALFKQFGEEGTVFFRYARVLLSYIREGDSAGSSSLKQEARSYNNYVPRLFSGRMKMPKAQPATFGLGSKDEAVLYVFDNLDLWRNTPGAIPWLLKSD